MEVDRRKEELEKKRQKLAELRRAREERKQVFIHAAQKQEEKPVVSNINILVSICLYNRHWFIKMVYLLFI